MKTKVNFYNPLIYFHDEIWKNIKKDGYNLKVSNFGKVILIKYNKEQLLNQYDNLFGYLYVAPSVNGKQKKFKIHKLITEAFIENPKNKKYINHKDGFKYNNFVENLEWCTASENIKHAYKTLLNDNPIGEKSRASKLSNIQVREIKQDIYNGLKIKDIALKFGVTKAEIYHIKNKKIWRHIKVNKFENLDKFF